MAELGQLSLFESDVQKTPGGPRQSLPWAVPLNTSKPREHQSVPGLWETGPTLDHLLTLDAVAEAVADCRLCKLQRARTNTVPGEGNPQAQIMFIGEGPGREEDLQGLPFVGAAGKLLDKLLISMGLRRNDVFIGNVVKCRPPGNRDPQPDEVQACMPYLARQIKLINPDVIVVMGATALKALIDPKARITTMRGKWLERSGIKVMPTFHPAALLRNPSRKLPVWEDMKQVLRYLNVF